MRIDLDILAEAIAVLRDGRSLGRRRALRGVLAHYPAARALIRSPE